MSKTHYRKVFKSDHLGIADLEDMIEANSNLIFTIKCVKQEIGVRVAGKKGNHNIAYFHENIKPLVLNATNSKVVSTLANSKFIEDWANVAIQLYIDPTVKMKGEIVGGVRINPNPPAQKIELLPENQKLWSNAVQAFKRDGNLDKVLARVNISPENQQRIANEAQQ